MNIVTTKEECFICKGTKLFTPKHLREKGIAYVCTTCGGKGWQERSYTIFQEKEKIEGIEFIKNGNSQVTYAEFLAGKMP